MIVRVEKEIEGVEPLRSEKDEHLHSERSRVQAAKKEPPFRSGFALFSLGPFE